MVAVDFDRAFHQLCHLAALNSTDKVRGAVENLVATLIALDDQSEFKGPDAIASAALALFGVQLESASISTSLDSLLESRRIERARDGRFQATTHERAAVQERVKSARDLEAEVRREWLQELAGILQDDPALPDALWRCLNQYLALAFKQHGAETVRLLDPSLAPTMPASARLADYLEFAVAQSGLSAHRGLAGDALDLFFASVTPARAAYITQLLDGTFTFYAVSLDERTTDYLLGTLERLNVFLDTNYIFGLLDLHDNFFVTASKELVRFIQENDLPFKLYFHEYTLAEIQRTLHAQSEALKARRWSVALSRAVIRADTTVGLERLYHRLNQDGPLDVDAFLSRYESIELLLRPLGLTLYREGRGAPFTVEEKGLLVAEYSDFMKQHAPRERAYEAMDHDVSVLLALRHQRTPGRPALSSGAVFLTNDYWFHRFSWSLLQAQWRSLRGTVALPTHFLQLLRPFVPSTRDYDRRFVEAFALPEFRIVQTGYNETSQKVLSYLATYSDLPTETAVRILRDHALETRVARLDPSSSAFADQVELAIVSANRELLEENIALERERDRAAAVALEMSEKAESEAARASAAEEELAAVYAQPKPDQMEAASIRAAQAEIRAARYLAVLRGLLGVVVFVLGVVAILIGPQLVGWSALDAHTRVAGIKLAAIGAWAGVAVAIGHKNGAKALWGTLIAGLLTIAQFL